MQYLYKNFIKVYEKYVVKLFMNTNEIIDLRNLSTFDAIKSIMQISAKTNCKIYCKVASPNINSLLDDLPINHNNVEFV